MKMSVYEDYFDDEPEEYFYSGKKSKSKSKPKSMKEGKGKGRRRYQDDLDWQMSEEENLPSWIDMVKHPFIIQQNNRYYATLQSVLQLAKDYPNLYVQFKNSPLLMYNPNGDMVKIITTDMQKGFSGDFSVNSTRIDIGRVIYLIGINQRNVLKIRDGEYSKENLLEDIVHEYTHALQMNLKYEYNDKVYGRFKDDNFSDIEYFYYEMLVEADAFTKEKFFVDKSIVGMSDVDVQKKMMDTFKSELTRLSNLYLDMSYSEGYEGEFAYMLTKNGFKFKKTFHDMMEYIIQSGTAKTGGNFPKYNIDWTEIDEIISVAIMANTQLHVMKNITQMQMKDVLNFVKENATKGQKINPDIISSQYNKITTKEDNDSDKYPLIQEVVALREKQLKDMKMMKQKKKIDAERRRILEKERAAFLEKVREFGKKMYE